jgi:hypothetical protein
MERIGGYIKLIRHKLAKKEYLGLPRQNVNRRVSLVKLDSENAAVVIWSKSSNTIITIITVDQYIERFGGQIKEKKINVSSETIREYCKYFNLDSKIVKDALEFFPDEMVKDLQDFSRYIN